MSIDSLPLLHKDPFDRLLRTAWARLSFLVAVSQDLVAEAQAAKGKLELRRPLPGGNLFLGLTVR